MEEAERQKEVAAGNTDARIKPSASYRYSGRGNTFFTHVTNAAYSIALISMLVLSGICIWKKRAALKKMFTPDENNQKVIEKSSTYGTTAKDM